MQSRTLLPTTYGSRRRLGTPLALGSVLGLAALGTAGCAKDDPNALAPSGGTGTYCNDGTGNGSGTGGDTGTGGGSPVTPQSILDTRELSYTEALRTASFKLVGNAPTLEQIKSLEAITDEAEQAVRYEELIDELMDDTRFKQRMIDFWKNTMRQGGPAMGAFPSRDTAPTFAAMVTVQGMPYTDLFTAAAGTCPTFDGVDFVAAECPSGATVTGLLADSGIHAQNYGNLAFLRVRFFQETFSCRKLPAELTDDPTPVGNGTYTAPWPFTSIAGAENGGRIDFLDTESAICANCHATMNHRAPLFANFDINGAYTPDISVFIPIEGEPLALMSDWLPPGETTAWRYGLPAATLSELGAHMAADAEVQACAVIRMWNFAFSKGDVVNDAATVPTEVIAPVLEQFKSGNFNLREAVRAVFLHDDFVRF
jgi:hypothetical protein